MPYYPERRPDPYAEEQKRIAEAAARSKRRRLALVAVFSLLIIYSGIRLAAYGADYYASRQTSQTLYELYEEPTEVPVEATPVPTAVPVTAAPVQGTPVPIPEPTESVFLQPVPYPDNPTETEKEKQLYYRLAQHGRPGRSCGAEGQYVFPDA